MTLLTGPDTEEEKLAWLRLFRSENVGPATFRHLMARFGTATEALDRVPDLAARGGLKRSIKLATTATIEKEKAELESTGARLVFQGGGAYPPLLAEIEQGPPILTVWGDASLLLRPALGMVGARNASAAGRKFARKLSGDLGKEDYVVASGLARGIDTAAHEGALDTGTIAVMAGGANHIYPPQNEDLFNEIQARGCIVSEMPWGMQPQARHFPRRNRIISGLSQGVVVVEAAARSGSLITARYALEQNREVFAVPGSPIDPRTEGTNKLIQDGAALVLSVGDVIDHLARPSLMADAPSLRNGEFSFDEPDEAPQSLRDEVIALLGGTPIDLDDLAREVGQPVGMISGILLELELAGRVERMSGSAFRRLS